MKMINAFRTLLYLVISTFLFNSCQKTSEENMVLYPVQDDPTVSFRIWFKTGSQNDPAGKEGLAALTASMMTEGSSRQHSYEEILELLYPLAAGINSQVDKEMTIIYGRTHKDNLDKYYQLFSEVLLHPAFNESDFKRIKSDRLNYLEKSLRYSNDEELGKEVLSEFIFQGTPYEHIEEGHVSSLNNISLEDVRNFYNKFYTRNNVVIGLGGGYDEALAERIQKDLRNLPEGGPGTPQPPQVEAINGMEIKIVEKDANATAISFGFPIDVLRGSKDYYALAIANSWLGEHRNSISHLYQVIREERGLNYGDYSYIEHFPNGGSRQFPPPNVARRQQIFQVWIRPVPNYAKLFAFRAALHELKHLIDDGMSPEEFELTKKFLNNYVLHYAPTTMAQLGYTIDDKFYGIEEHHLKIFREMLDEITLEDVNSAIRKHLNYKNMKIVFVTENAENLKRMLTENTPSRIEYDNPMPDKIQEEDRKISSYPLDIETQNVSIVPIETVFQ